LSLFCGDKGFFVARTPEYILAGSRGRIKKQNKGGKEND
jgi:hypothetical protein